MINIVKMYATLAQTTKSIRGSQLLGETDKALQECSNTFRNVLLSPEVRLSLEYLSELEQKHKEELKSISKNSDRFSQFIEHEKELLRKEEVAVESETVNQMCEIIDKELIQGKQLSFNNQPIQIINNVYTIYQTNLTPRQLPKYNQNQKKKVINNSLIALGSLCLIGVNASPLGAALGAIFEAGLAGLELPGLGLGTGNVVNALSQVLGNGLIDYVVVKSV
jgi:hypothetical protein